MRNLTITIKPGHELSEEQFLLYCQSAQYLQRFGYAGELHVQQDGKLKRGHTAGDPNHCVIYLTDRRNEFPLDGLVGRLMHMGVDVFGTALSSQERHEILTPLGPQRTYIYTPRGTEWLVTLRGSIYLAHQAFDFLRKRELQRPYIELIHCTPSSEERTSQQPRPRFEIIDGSG